MLFKAGRRDLEDCLFASVDGLLEHNSKLGIVDISMFLAKANEVVVNGRLNRVVDGRSLVLLRLLTFGSVPVRGLLFLSLMVGPST
jgi:hypothetical protein